jgi:ABC-type polysaccharide/polyol phosphate transport system ATPase subunit
MSRIMLDVCGVTKDFQRVRSEYGLKDILLHSVLWLRERKRKKKFTAVDDISFSVAQGESLAVLGANGAGKSTLLSLLAGIIEPSSGSIVRNGRIGLMLELGSGFCHDLSGRENIILNGLLLGAKGSWLKKVEDDIIEFSGVRDFIDEPLRTYSTGMQTRLGFAIAVHMQPDILLIDEVLSVGDSDFRRKCLARLRQMQQQGVTVVLVTHSLQDAVDFCTNAIYLHKGKIIFSGTSGQVADAIQRNNYEY